TGIQGNEYIEVLSGLLEGDVVVTGPYSAVSRKLKGGARIVVTDKKIGDNPKDKAKVEVD
ncbi:MAG: HlyD family secretion protein, partial [Saprospiraceae bacterium]